jgi:hypothetical protein
MVYLSIENTIHELELDWELFPQRGIMKFTAKEKERQWRIDFLPTHTIMWKKGNIPRWMAPHHLREYLGYSPLQWRDIEFLLKPWCSEEPIESRFSEDYSRVNKGGHDEFPDSLSVKKGSTKKQIWVEEFKPYGQGKIPSILWIQNETSKAKIQILKVEKIQTKNVF